VLKHLDNLGIYDLTEHGPISFLLLDAHDFRLQQPFLSYVNSKHELGQLMWVACIGLTNATQKWQVGDSNEQNGCWKMSWYKEKDKLVLYKKRNGMKTDLMKMDIIPLMLLCWEQSFARREKNQNAIMQRGWYFCDQRLLKDPEIECTRITDDTEDTATTVSALTQESGLESLNLNFSEGRALEISVDILQQMDKKKAIYEALIKRRQEGRMARGRLDSALKDVRLTGGALFKVSKCVLDNDVLELRTARDNEAIEKQQEVLSRAVDAYNKRLEKYTKLLDKKKDAPLETFTNAELCVWLKV